MNNQSFFDQLSKSGWNQIGLASIFCANVLLLFISDVPENVGKYLLPALMVFGLGFIVLGYIEGTVYRKNFDQVGSAKLKHPYRRFFAANSIWFILFVIYLFYRGIL